MTDIHTQDRYKSEFPDEKGKNALAQALDIRKFEIELYWKRAAYFWSLIAAAFAGYFALANNDDKLLPLIISCIGLILSFGWYLVNRGSKYWQANWERHVDCLEDNENGPLYKTIITKDRYSIFKFWSGYPFSVSRVNQLISLFISIVWAGLVVKAFPVQILPEYFYTGAHWLTLGLTVTFLVMLATLGRGSSEKTPRIISFSKSPLQNKNEQ